MGSNRFYNAVLRYYHDSCKCTIKFDGIDAVWRYATLEGEFGPLNRYDLYIGAQIQLFGRHLTIMTSTAVVCRWIDEEASFLEMQRLWLQEKISASGNQPIIKKEPQFQIQHVERITKTTGTKNLRRIFTQVCKLKEQLVDLGLGHFIVSIPKQKKMHSKK